MLRVRVLNQICHFVQIYLNHKRSDNQQSICPKDFCTRWYLANLLSEKDEFLYVQITIKKKKSGDIYKYMLTNVAISARPS